MFEAALQDIKSLYSGGLSRAGHQGCIQRQDVHLWTHDGKCTLTQTFDTVGLGLAKEFVAGKLSRQLCDSALNDLFHQLCSFVLDPVWEIEEPEAFTAIYEAFDLSETAGSEHAERVAREEITAILQQQTDVEHITHTEQ